MAKKSSRGMALVFVVLIVGLLASNVSAASEGFSGDLTTISSKTHDKTFIGVDTTPPSVTNHAPVGKYVPVTTTITITFDDAMNTDSVESAFFLRKFGLYMRRYTKKISGEYEWSQKNTVMTFTPSSDLDYDTNYGVGFGLPTASINRLPMDSSGNILSKYDSWQFTTVSEENAPPNKPAAPDGPPLGQPAIAYTYYASTTDPNGDQITYVFDWGDGTTSGTDDVGSGETVSRLHAWAKFGEYSVRVNATDGNGASSDWSEPRVVVVGTEEQIPPVAIIAAAPMELGEGETVSFSASESSDGNGEIVSYDWDFGDGSTGTGVNVEHTYARSGQYTATLTVTDNDGLSATNGVIITVEPPDDPSNKHPTANATIRRDEGGPSVTFEGSGVDNDGEVVECRWISPDGQIRTYLGSSASFTLEDPPTGTYRFAVKDGDGAWSEEVELNLFDTGGGGGGGGGDLLPIIVLLAIAAIVAMGYLYVQKRKIPPEPDANGDEFGSISATSNPDGATVALDNVGAGESPATINNVPVGHHTILFTKTDYSDCEKKVVVNADQITQVHCDLKKPEIKLVLSAEPTEIPADGKSKSVITVGIEANGVPVPAPKDIEIVLETNIGLIDTPVTILKGDVSTTSILTSSTAGGTAAVKVESEAGLKNDVAVRFV